MKQCLFRDEKKRGKKALPPQELEDRRTHTLLLGKQIFELAEKNKKKIDMPTVKTRWRVLTRVQQNEQPVQAHTRLLPLTRTGG